MFFEPIIFSLKLDNSFCPNIGTGIFLMYKNGQVYISMSQHIESIIPFVTIDYWFGVGLQRPHLCCTRRCLWNTKNLSYNEGTHDFQALPFFSHWCSIPSSSKVNIFNQVTEKVRGWPRVRANGFQAKEPNQCWIYKRYSVTARALFSLTPPYPLHVTYLQTRFI